MGIMRRFSSLSSNNIKNKNLNSLQSTSFDNENINLKEERSSNSSISSNTSKTTDKQSFDINANLEAYKQRCKALEVENKRLMSNLGIMMENNNKNNEEINHLKEQMKQQNNEKQELLNLIQRLNTDCEKERELAREWQRVGQFNNKVAQRDIQRYQSRIERLEQKCAKLGSESVELKKLCLYLSRQRQALWAQLSYIEKIKNNAEGMSDEYINKSTHDMIENNNNSQFQIDGIQESALQLIYSDMQSSYLLAQLEAAPRQKVQQLEKEENEYSTIPCSCPFPASPSSSTLTNTTVFGSSFGSSSSSDDTTTIFVLGSEEQQNQKIKDPSNIIFQPLPQLQVRELCTINEEKESDNDLEENNEYLNIQNDWKFKEKYKEKFTENTNLEDIFKEKNQEKNKNSNRNSSTSTTSTSSSSGAFSATSSNGDEFRGENEEKREDEEENDYLPPEMPLIKQEHQRTFTSTASLIGRPSSCMETNILSDSNYEQYQSNTRSTLPRVNNSSNTFPASGINGRLSPRPRRKMVFVPNEQQQKQLIEGKIIGGPPMRIRIRPPPTNTTIQMPQLIKKDLQTSKTNIITAL